MFFSLFRMGGYGHDIATDCAIHKSFVDTASFGVTKSVEHARFSPDGKFLIGLDNRGRIVTWDANKGGDVEHQFDTGIFGKSKYTDVRWFDFQLSADGNNILISISSKTPGIKNCIRLSLAE